MMQRTFATVAVSGTLLLATQADAYEVRCRFVERIGTTDVVLPPNYYFTGRFMRIRLQIGVFDDAHSAAPAGGLVGWRGEQHHFDLRARRTPGRLPNFAFPADGNGMPVSDPFVDLTQIDAERGPQTLVWDCAAGVPLPTPQVVIRGRNTFVSVWETTIEHGGHCGHQILSFTGAAIVAPSWVVMGNPTPPICDPATPGSVTFVPSSTESQPFSCELWFYDGPPPQPVPDYWWCSADWHRDYSLNSQDFFDFLADFFAGFGDTNCDHVTDSRDLFYFLEQFLNNCGL